MHKTIYRVAQGKWNLEVNGKSVGEFDTKEMAKAVATIVDVNNVN